MLPDALPGGESGEGDGGGCGKIVALGHGGQGVLVHCHIFSEGTDFAQGQPGIDLVAFVEADDPAARLLHHPRALVAQGERHGIILDQPDAAGQDQQLQRVHRRGFHLYQHFGGADVRRRDLPHRRANLFCISVNLNRLHGKSFFLCRCKIKRYNIGQYTTTDV